jgi:hypothetical protein
VKTCGRDPSHPGPCQTHGWPEPEKNQVLVRVQLKFSHWPPLTHLVPTRDLPRPVPPLPLGGGGAALVEDFLIFCEIAKKKDSCPLPLTHPDCPSAHPSRPIKVLFAEVQHELGQNFLILDRSNPDRQPMLTLDSNPSLLMTRKNLNRTIPDRPVFKSLNQHDSRSN